MKKILFALSMLAFVALPQARGADISVDFFYNNLSGGNWIEVEGYGYGWQPDVAVSDPNWRPYADGYWAYTDYGWTWISYEDFGWATYHYGRWANLGDYGWTWFPGSDLDWGPAWVSWRTGGDYIGWAPLPPRGVGVVYEGQPIGASVDIEYDIGPEYYNFCDVRFIGEPVLRDRIFPSTQNVTYINNTVNVTNITVQNNVVYNYGPDYNVVSTYSSRPIQRLTIQRETAADLSAAAKTGGLTKVQGNRLVVAAPNKFAKAPPSVAPPAVKAKVAQPKIERGWAGVSNQAELKQKIKTENPKNIPPPTRAAARAAGSPPPGAREIPPAEARPAREGKPGRALPGATAAPPEGGSPQPFERGKARGRPGVQPGATMPPGAGEAVPPSERGKARGRPGVQPGASIPPGAGEAAPPSERGKAHGRPGAQPGGTMPPAGTNLNSSKSNALREGAPPGQPGAPPDEARGAKERRQGAIGQPAGQPRGETPTEPERGPGQPERGKKKAEPPAEPVGTNLNSSKSNASREGAPPGQPGAPPGEARGARERGQGASGQPAAPARGGAPATTEHIISDGKIKMPPPAERSTGQPEHGKKKAEKESPPPGP